MINRPLPDLDKIVKIHHDNAEVARFRSVGVNFECKISKFGAGNSNLGNCVMRTLMGKPGSTFSPFIYQMANQINQERSKFQL